MKRSVRFKVLLIAAAFATVAGGSFAASADDQEKCRFVRVMGATVTTICCPDPSPDERIPTGLTICHFE